MISITLPSRVGSNFTACPISFILKNGLLGQKVAPVTSAQAIQCNQLIKWSRKLANHQPEPTGLSEQTYAIAKIISITVCPS